MREATESCPRPPILVIDGGDVQIFDSVGDAIHEMEPVDVDDGVYRIFDSIGDEYGISTNGDEIIVSGRIGNEEAHVIDILREFILTLRQSNGGISNNDLPNLLRLLK